MARNSKTTILEKRRFVTRSIKSWLKNEFQKHYGYLRYEPKILSEAVLWIIDKIDVHVKPKIKENLVIILCDKMKGMIHIAYGPDNIIFHECGCQSKQEKFAKRFNKS